MKVLSKNALHIAAVLAVVATCASCSDVVVPRPRGYFRITLPEHEYAAWDSTGFPYSFEKSIYAKAEPDRDDDAEPYWINVYYPEHKARIHLTYRDISNDVDEALEDSRRLAYKHTIKADAIGENYFSDEEKQVYGVLYQIKGNAATPLQFMLTDSTTQMFRGSLYFYCKPNKDSLAPVIDFMEEDVAHLVESFRWRKN